MNVTTIITAILSLLFLMIGLDKFFAFLEPPCSLMETISPTIWNFLGVLQIAAAIFIWLPKIKRPVAVFFTLFMLFFSIIHLMNNTYDIGGALFMAILLALLAWNPRFIRNKKKQEPISSKSSINN